MLVKCLCNHCSGHLEFEGSRAGERVDCPHCGMETLLYVPIVPLYPLTVPQVLAGEPPTRGGRPPPGRVISQVIQQPSTPPIMEPSLAPSTLDEFIGQSRAKERLALAMAAAKSRRRPLGHVLLEGPPGSGKRTLAEIVARSMGSAPKTFNGRNIEKAPDLAGILTNLDEGDVLLVEDIFRLRNQIEEYLCEALEEFTLDIIIDQGPNARSVHLNLPRFTLIGTTPAKQRLSSSLLSRFQIVESLEPYSAEQLSAIARNFAVRLGTEIDEAAALEVARSSGGTPRELLRRFLHVRDFAEVRTPAQKITADIAAEALKMLGPPHESAESSGGRRSIPSAVRREVWRRDGGKCVRCGSRENLEFDHIVPVIKGGSSTARNVELLCEKCNNAKRDSIQ